MQRRMVQVTDTVPLAGGLEIYGTDRHGNRVYIPAHSWLPEHQYVMASGQVCCSVLQCVLGVLQCVAVCCSVQCVAVTRGCTSRHIHSYLNISM